MCILGQARTPSSIHEVCRCRALRASGSLAILLALASCAELLPLRPLTLPAADGRAEQVVIGDGFRYVVNRQALQQAQGGVVMRITRASAPELDYSDGLTAKKVAEAYCAGFKRSLDPSAYGRFSAPASWVFGWGCT